MIIDNQNALAGTKKINIVIMGSRQIFVKFLLHEEAKDQKLSGKVTITKVK